MKQRTKLIRRGGFAFFAVVTLVVCVPMLIGVIKGIASQRIWDPYTDQMLSDSKSDESECRSRAERLIRQAGTMTVREPAWEEQVRVWTVRCRKEHPEAYQMLTSTRRHIGKDIMGEERESPL